MFYSKDNELQVDTYVSAWFWLLGVGNPSNYDGTLGLGVDVKLKSWSF